MLVFTDHPARRWELKRPRLRLFTIAARIADHGRTRRLHLSGHAPGHNYSPPPSTGSSSSPKIPAPS